MFVKRIDQVTKTAAAFMCVVPAPSWVYRPETPCDRPAQSRGDRAHTRAAAQQFFEANTRRPLAISHVHHPLRPPPVPLSATWAASSGAKSVRRKNASRHLGRRCFAQRSVPPLPAPPDSGRDGNRSGHSAATTPSAAFDQVDEGKEMFAVEAPSLYKVAGRTVGGRDDSDNSLHDAAG